MAPAMGGAYVDDEGGMTKTVATARIAKNSGSDRERTGNLLQNLDGAARERRRTARTSGVLNVTKLSVPHDAFVFVGDGRKALFLRNEGDEKYANFVTEQVLADENPPNHEQGTDRPGRAFASANSSARSAMESTDWHELEEQRFAQQAATALEAVIRERGAPAVVLAAPAKTLAELRRTLHADVKGKVIAEIDKDFTKIPVWEIEKHIVG
jgi:protein required for attachment to host cells